MCQVILILLALVAPPLAVLLDQGCTCDLCLNILLTALFFIPGVIHAIYVILTKKPVTQNIYVHTSTYEPSAPTYRA